MAKKPVVINAAAPPGSLFAPAKRAFREGGVIAYPTETFYGLCVDPFNPAAVKRLFALKGRDFSNPVALIIADPAMLKGLALEIPRQGAVLMERFWPGPLTLVLKAAPSVPPSLIAGRGKVGVRVSSHPVARALSQALSSPITATSANPAGKKAPTTPQEVLDYFNGSIDVLIDGGRLTGKLGSTIVDITGDNVRVLREGEIASSEVLEALG